MSETKGNNDSYEAIIEEAMAAEIKAIEAMSREELVKFAAGMSVHLKQVYAHIIDAGNAIRLQQQQLLQMLEWIKYFKEQLPPKKEMILPIISQPGQA